jgi:hopanoid biosynthesis associated radical SAM protein HpnH
MAVPLRQSVKVGSYIVSQRLKRREKYALVLELEPLFQCNLECAGCGKIQHPDHILRRRMSVQDAVGAVEECGAPVVSIAGGEPLIHPEIDVIASELIKRKRFVYLCTNAILMAKKLDRFTPSPYFAWAVHMDGLRERHDKSVCRDGVFDKAVDAIREAKRRGFRVTTNTTFFSDDTPQTVREVLDYLNDELEIDQMMISPAYAYQKAPDQDHFPGVEQTRRLFRAAFADGRRRRWRLNHSPLYLDFLEGRIDFRCTAWGIPSYSIFGWQRPCYLMGDGYASSYRELIDETDWDRYGRGRDPRCDNCMAHCGYEPTAVNETLRAPHKALAAALRGGPAPPPPRRHWCRRGPAHMCAGQPVYEDSRHRRQRLHRRARRGRA